MKKFLLIFLAVLTLNFTCSPVQAETVTLNTLKSKYPDGMIWNGSYYLATQCAGFARLLFDEYYGYNPVLYAEKSLDLSKLKPGDVLRYSGDGSYDGGHEVWVIGVNGDEITVAECNWVGRNMVSWGRKMYKSHIVGQVQHIYVAPYAIGGSAPALKAATGIKVGLDSAKTKTVISWNQQSGVTGYQVEIYKAADASAGNFVNPVKVITLNKPTTTSAEISKFEAGDYYIYVRTKRIDELSTRGTGVRASINPITSVTLDKTSVSTVVDKTISLSATVNPSDTNYSKKITWSSTNESVASVDQNGNVTTHALGYATIEATAVNGVVGRCSISVNYTENPIRYILLKQYRVTLKQNETFKIEPQYYPTDATGDLTITFTSRKPEIASVDQDGIVTALAEGEASIWVNSVNGMGISFDVTVTDEVTYPIKQIKLSENNIELTKGESKTLDYEILPANTTDSKYIYWSTSDSSVATVSSGKITAKGVGTATITARNSKGINDTCLVTVTPKPIDAVSVSKVAKVEYTGSKIEPTVTVEDNGVKLIKDKDYKITYQNNIEPGTGIIVITGLNGYTGNKIIEFEIFKRYIKLSNTSLRLTKNSTATITAEFINSPYTSTPKFTWTSSNKKVATIDENGKITALSNGSTTITVSYNDYTATCNVIVGDYLKGDINNDGKVDVLDAREALGFAVGKHKVTEQIILSGDMDLDKKITATDAAQILKVYLKK